MDQFTEYKGSLRRKSGHSKSGGRGKSHDKGNDHGGNQNRGRDSGDQNKDKNSNDQEKKSDKPPQNHNNLPNGSDPGDDPSSFDEEPTDDQDSPDDNDNDQGRYGKTDQNKERIQISNFFKTNVARFTDIDHPELINQHLKQFHQQYAVVNIKKNSLEFQI